VLREFGVPIPARKVRVWDSSAQIRWFVIPERPANTGQLNEAQLAAGPPEAMMGVALVPAPPAV
jgi:nitrile hydratase